jgi:hypothetical protein
MDFMRKYFKGYNLFISFLLYLFPLEGPLETCRGFDTSMVVTRKQSGGVSLLNKNRIGWGIK